jgi:hypothetical protein
MSLDLWVGIAALIVGVAAFMVAIYAIKDVRHLVRRHVIEAQAYAVFVEATNRLCWEFITATKPLYSPEMSVLFGRFAQLEHALDPKRTGTESKECIENEALVLADSLVTTGGARWNDGVDIEKITTQLHFWNREKAKVRMRNIFGGSFLP